MENRQKLTPIERVYNRKWMIVENANAQNNFIDCDVIALNIRQLQRAELKEDIESHASDIISSIRYRGGNTLRIQEFLQEIKDIEL